jgi:hypothetical protein
MREKIQDPFKLVFVEVADIFLAQNKVEEIPNDTLQPEEYAAWLKVEDKATKTVFKRVAAKAKKEGYNPKPEVVITHEQMTTHLEKKGYTHEQAALPFGLNGMYMLRFKKVA